MDYILQAMPNRVRKGLNRRLSLIRALASGITIIQTLALLNSLSQILSRQLNITAYVYVAVISAAIIMNITVYFLAKPNVSLEQADLAASIMVCAALGAVTVLYLVAANKGPFTAAFLLAPCLAGLTGLKRTGTLLTSVGAALAMILSLASSSLIKNEEIKLFEITDWLLVYSTTVTGILIFVQRLDKSIAIAEEQADNLTRLVQTLNAGANSGAILSQQLTGITTQLNVASHEYATHSQEQVAALIEVTVSLEELSSTAVQISNNADLVTEATNEMVKVAAFLREKGELAEVNGTYGVSSVEQTIKSVERVRNRIELLGQRLLHLTEQTRQVGTIIDLIEDIADETHLLALNASIEAAGTANQESFSSSNGRRGDRFGVIAQEIKNLSDRSREATEEVRGTIMEMQGAVANAVLVAEEGKKETVDALTRSQIAGAVIEKLSEVITHGANNAVDIFRAAQTVNNRCDEISLATSQQRSANQQILLTMRNIAVGSQESFGRVAELTQTVSRVNSQMDELSIVLTGSSQSANLAISGY